MNHSGHSPQTTNMKALKISAVLIFIYFFLEVVVAIATGSLSLLADAAHEMSTVVAIGMSLIAGRLATSKPTAQRTFGLRRAETIAALFNGLLLVGMAIFIIYNGLNRLANPIEMTATPMFAMAIGGIGLEIASLIIMYKGQKDNLNIRGSFWHVMNAFLGSIAVIIAAIFIQFWQIYAADTWAGLLFAIILLYAAYGIIRDALRILIDKVPDGIDLAKVEHDLQAITGVLDIHHVHARTISGSITTFSAHLIVKPGSNERNILAKAKQITEQKYGFSLSTIQIEDCSVTEKNPLEVEYKNQEKT
jgi:cobalt-zinc-cadmium efflux system protein